MSVPYHRPRRRREHPVLRDLVSETRISPKDLIQPLFVHDRKGGPESISSMPGQSRHNRQTLFSACDELLKKKIHAVALFPHISEGKSLDASEAWNPEGLIPSVIRDLKKRYGNDLLIISDVALDCYTSHGQDGLVNDKGKILNDETLSALAKQACVHAEAGADLVAPSDMMDGRVAAIRHFLDDKALIDTGILAYTAKYASSFYGPFRDAVGSKQALGNADKRTYQMDPANQREACIEASLDEAEGADILMVKPAMLYLDVISALTSVSDTPIWAYQVSGEYAMIHAAAQNGWLDLKKAALESLIAIKRSGARAILTYFASEIATELS